jgi:phosphatidylglycerophosphate synthase
MLNQLPNTLTLFRLVIALVFFIILGHYRYPSGPNGALAAAFILFIVGAITDWLDGYLARRLHVESTFGRIMDPFCDKVLILGAFIFLAGPRFVDPSKTAEQGIFWSMIPGNTVSGIYPWMVALMLARELLVTAVRSEVEGRGVEFGANIWGKLKTVLQMITVPAILAGIWFDPFAPGHGWTIIVRNVLVSAVVIVTLLSGLPYITGAMRIIKQDKNK